MKPLPRAASGTVVTLDGDLYNCIADNLERMDKWTVQPPLQLQQTPAGNLLGFAAPQNEIVLVAITGTETGGGYYKGTILTGRSNGGNGNDPANPPATYNFQLQVDFAQTQTDGPSTPTHSGGAFVNNALVVNLPEQYVAGSHLLYVPEARLLYAYGRVMGQTSETNPRTIVYLETWPIVPVFVKITGNNGGAFYYGEIVRGQFASSNSPNSLSAQATVGLTGTNNCWIVNSWEQAYGPSGAGPRLQTGMILWGMMAGWPVGSLDSGGSSSNKTWYMVYTFMPPQMPALARPVQSIETGNTAGATYGFNEQQMLNLLKADVNNLQATLADMYNALIAAGYLA